MKLKAFEDLGDTVTARWKESGRREEAFVEIATIAIRDTGVLHTVEPTDIVSWLMTSGMIPEQDPYDFGQPPIRVYNGQGFYIQVLFWVDSTTSIHEHSFMGAFGVLHGSSVESTYAFTPERMISERLMAGCINHLSSELLYRGDIHPIYSGDRLIHSLFHLDRPSLSLVVRTPRLSSSRPQYYYSRPYFALHDENLPKSARIQFQMLESLWTFDPTLFWKAAQELSLCCDPYILHQVLAMAYRISSSSPGNWSTLLGIASDRDQWLVDRILSCLEEERRTEKLKGLRADIHDPMHRFFLALLLNVPSRDELYRLVHQRFPEERTSALVIRWLGEIFKEERAKLRLTPSWLLLLNRILEDPEFENSRTTLNELFKCKEEGDEEKIRKAWTYLRSVDLLKPLMTTTVHAHSL